MQVGREQRLTSPAEVATDQRTNPASRAGKFKDKVFSLKRAVCCECQTHLSIGDDARGGRREQILAAEWQQFEPRQRKINRNRWRKRLGRSCRTQQGQRGTNIGRHDKPCLTNASHHGELLIRSCQECRSAADHRCSHDIRIQMEGLSTDIRVLWGLPAREGSNLHTLWALMPIPRIAIVGRPNVGKSSLLNMIAHEKISIVDPTAGTTRDRVSIIADLVPPNESVDSQRKITIEVTDTGGFGAYFGEDGRFDDIGNDLTRLTDDIEFQISEAVAGADLVLFVIDAQEGITPRDLEIAKLLRERVLGGGRGTKARKQAGTADENAQIDEDERGAKIGRPSLRIQVIANKTDGPRWEAHGYEAAAMGFGEPLCVSAKNNYFRRDFLDALYERVSKLPGVRTGPQVDDIRADMKIAIIGKRNAGKSSLVNALAGEKRVIVSEIPGTTRDAVDVVFEMDGKSFVAIDTAGLRKKKSFADRIEHFAFDRAQRAIDRADVVFVMLDATEPVSQVDQQLMWLVQNAYKPCLIVVNKWDLVEGRTGNNGKLVTTETYEEYLRKETKGLDFAPITFISAERGTNVVKTIKLGFALMKQSAERASTGRLNRKLREILDTRGPSSKLGTFAKAYFIAQVAVSPPTIVIVVNNDALFTNNYQRFLLNALRKELPYPEVPIKLIIKNRKRARLQDLETGEHHRKKLEALGAAALGQANIEIDDAEWDAQLEGEFGDEIAEARDDAAKPHTLPDGESLGEDGAEIDFSEDILANLDDDDLTDLDEPDGSDDDDAENK